jgi:hypothetical protein
MSLPRRPYRPRRARGKMYRSPVADDFKPSEQEDFWRKCTAPLLEMLQKPHSVDKIIEWSRTNLPGADYVNALAWLSIHDLITPCYDESNRPHWVTVKNVPHGWSLHAAAKPAMLSRRIKKADLEAATEAAGNTGSTRNETSVTDLSPDLALTAS